MMERAFTECLRYNIEHNWNEDGLFESMIKDDCVKACDKIEQLETEVKSQAKHIELLNQCDDSSTEVIAKMDGEIETLKQSCRNHQVISEQRLGRIKNLEAVIERQKCTIINQGIGCEERHNVLCGVKEAIDEYFGD